MRPHGLRCPCLTPEVGEAGGGAELKDFAAVRQVFVSETAVVSQLLVFELETPRTPHARRRLEGVSPAGLPDYR